ncbi:MAG: hypothetical protein OES99_08195, partial [Gammaproteobacteria bacterium]|nr:hypothetical protein [Gammaproteobacteria bacterium]
MPVRSIFSKPRYIHRVVCSTGALLCALPMALMAERFELPSQNLEVVGLLSRINVAFEDTFVALGRSNGLGYEELVAANPKIDPWVPGADVGIVLPNLYVLP